MKTATVCYICKKIKRTSEMYNVKLTEFVPGTILDGPTIAKVENKILVCRVDAKKMGYSVKAGKSKTKPNEKITT